MTEKTKVDLCICPEWVIPIQPEHRTLQGCGLIIDQGNIVAIEPCSEIEQRFIAIETVHLPGQALLPGFVNAHGHAAMSLLRGFADDLPLTTWLEDHIWPAESSWVSEEFVRDGVKLAIAEMIKSGTTCFSDMYFFPETSLSTAVSTGIRHRATFPIFEFPSAWGNSVDEYLHKGLALRDQYKNHSLVNVEFGPHAPYTLSDESLTRVAMLSEELDARIHIHLHETQKEVEDSLRQYGQRPIARLENIGVIGPRTEAVHMTQISDADIELLEKYNCSVIHCPRSNMKLASGICDLKRLQQSNIQVGLGTDGAASNNNLSMLSELQTASLLAKLQSQDPGQLNAFDSLKLATLDSAKSIGLDHLIGSIEVGKAADLVSIDLSDVSTQPIYSPMSHICYAANSNQINSVWVSGKRILKDRQLTTINETELLHTSKLWAQKIKGS